MSAAADVTVDVVDNPEALRWEGRIDGALAGFADYRVHGDVVAFPHTETYPRHAGTGVASSVIRAALDAVVAAGRRIDPQCPFVADYIVKHPEYADHLAD